MSNGQPKSEENDAYLVIHVATTCDEHGVYVTKDSAEVIEVGWLLLDTNTLEESHRESVLVKPVNTPITPLCTSLTTITWEHVRSAGTFRDAITRIDAFVQEHLIAKEKNFSFVTLDSWDLRVQLPREARDKAVVLPPYLQHSRTFDLRTEYQRWQQHHPESLPFGPSSLTNICAALEVEPVQSSAPIKHNLPFHLQALAPASPRRALEEAITLTRVLQGLVNKSQPREDHPDVLARPLDAKADVKAFLSERSKVLHMNGLPHDTTQSELESWFTQFGGRPIAFWTLKTPDQHKPTGSGFAVFSSHEEAAESLCMNGRALNEKAIEVSPSSSRVLDRAAEILAPFPPSKNRPRPGDWTCPSCGFSNFQRRTACFRCSFPAASNTMMHDSMGYPGYGYGSIPMMPPHQHHHSHPHHQHHPMGPHVPPHGISHHGRGSGMVPFRAGDWKCGSDGCGYHNFAKNVSCLRCGASRAGAAVVADAAFAAGPDHHSPAYGMNHPPMASTAGSSPFGMHTNEYTSPGFPPQQHQHMAGSSRPFAMASGMNAPPPTFPPIGVPFGPDMTANNFGSRSVAAAFATAGKNGNAPGSVVPSIGPTSTTTPHTNGSTSTDYETKHLNGNVDESSDPLEFLSSGLDGLTVKEAPRPPSTTKSPLS